MPKPCGPDVGGGRGQRGAVQLDQLPDARLTTTGRNMKQGDVVLIWGATGGIGAYAAEYVLNGGGPGGASRQLGGQGRDPAQDGASRPSSTARKPATSSGRTSTPRTKVSGADSARTSRPPCSARTWDRLRAPGRLDVRRVDVRHQARRHRRHLRGDERVHPRVRQPSLLDAAEAPHRTATSPTTPSPTPPTSCSTRAGSSRC